MNLDSRSVAVMSHHRVLPTSGLTSTAQTTGNMAIALTAPSLIGTPHKIKCSPQRLLSIRRYWRPPETKYAKSSQRKLRGLGDAPGQPHFLEDGHNVWFIPASERGGGYHQSLEHKSNTWLVITLLPLRIWVRKV